MSSAIRSKFNGFRQIFAKRFHEKELSVLHNDRFGVITHRAFKHATIMVRLAWFNAP
jgi:hypothetical protein